MIVKSDTPYRSMTALTFESSEVLSPLSKSAMSPVTPSIVAKYPPEELPTAATRLLSIL